MKKLLLLLILISSRLSLWAQTDSVGIHRPDTILPPANATAAPEKEIGQPTSLLIGYLSYDSALVAMPDYAEVMAQMKQLRQSYDEEMKRVEDEFNSKYEAFLENRKDFPRTILLKRQTELQELLQRNIEFKSESRRDLRAREKELLAPLRIRLNETIAAIAREKKLTLVVNTDANACPFIEPLQGVDLNEEVALRLSR